MFRKLSLASLVLALVFLGVLLADTWSGAQMREVTVYRHEFAYGVSAIVFALLAVLFAVLHLTARLEDQVEIAGGDLKVQPVDVTLSGTPIASYLGVVCGEDGPRQNRERFLRGWHNISF